MAIKDHGVWRRYLPTAKEVGGAPRGALFLKRESDGLDWYQYVNTNPNVPAQSTRPVQFDPRSVKAVVEVVTEKDNSEVSIIRTAAVDATRLFPDGCRVVELFDIQRDQDEAALIEEFVWRRINPQTGDLGPKWEPPTPTPQIDDRVASALEMILERLERLEKK